jgi:hypothetical protein
MIIKKIDLLHALEVVKPGLGRQEQIQQTTSFAFITGRVVTYNDELSISHPLANCEIEGAIKPEERSEKANKGGCSNLREKLLPTPTAGDSPEKNTGKRNQDSLQKRAVQMTGKTSQLNPLFVEEMMGFPTGWILMPFLQESLSQENQLHSESGEKKV